MSDPVIVKLSRPLLAIDRELTELTIREPIGGDLSVCGYPVKLGADGADINPVNMSKMIGRLASIPVASVNAMPLCDWNACMKVVSGFFEDTTPETSTTDISN